MSEQSTASKDNGGTSKNGSQPPPPKPSTEQLQSLLDAFQSNMYPSMADDAAISLGDASLADPIRRVGWGWAPIVPTKYGHDYHGHYAIPERDAKANVVGIGLRRQDNKKMMYQGSGRGLIYPVNPEYDGGGGGYTPGPQNWVRSSVDVPCAVCGVHDGCLNSQENPKDPKAVICRKTKSTRPMGWGWLHLLKDESHLSKSVSPIAGDPNGTLFVVEGGSDVVVGLGLGLIFLGKPTNKGCHEYLAPLCQGRKVVVIGENDKKADGTWPGNEGMHDSARPLAVEGVASEVYTVLPPDKFKDIRSWWNAEKFSKEDFLAYVAQHGQRHALQPAGGQSLAIATRAVTSILETADLFKSGDQTYITVPIFCKDGVGVEKYETYSTRSKRAASYVMHHHWCTQKAAITDTAAKNVCTMFEALALHGGTERPIFLRVGYDDLFNVGYWNLGNGGSQVVTVTRDGWSITPRPDSIRFLHTSKEVSLPTPLKGGSWDMLRPFFPGNDEQAWILTIAWMVGTFHPGKVNPVLGFMGPQGCGKSRRTDRILDTLDPGTQRQAPKKTRDLAIACQQSALLAFENVSSFTDEISDMLCTIATGGSYQTRALYTDSDETHFKLNRPIVWNGIPECVTREDLKDRSILIRLSPFAEGTQKSDTEMLAEYKQVCPYIMGLLLDAWSSALRNLESVHLEKPPRMFDFTRWVVAAEESLPWAPGEFLAAYAENRSDITESSLEISTVATLVLSMMEKRSEWRGTAQDFLAEIANIGRNGLSLRPDFPKLPRIASDMLARVEPALNSRGIIIERSTPRTNRGKVIIIRNRNYGSANQ